MAGDVGKYAVKWEQKDVPDGYINVGRFWGVRGLRAVSVATLSVERGPGADELSSMLKEVISEQRDKGNILIRPWSYGSGISIYPKSGSGNLELSGVLPMFEVLIAKVVIEHGARCYKEYELHHDEIEIAERARIWRAKQKARKQRPRPVSRAREARQALADAVTQNGIGL